MSVWMVCCCVVTHGGAEQVTEDVELCSGVDSVLVVAELISCVCFSDDSLKLSLEAEVFAGHG